ncbi:asparagine synthetase B [Tropicimonas sp. IMCC6043]|uniref:asparagine synthetase B family protein n=1 Tax=Tropicimonas sp. IMCC6043 TaxID=2510645 RepID=UPI001F5DECDC|nr:asparagine synthase-related protein [Tropicimonas sp. IMCC6043]
MIAAMPHRAAGGCRRWRSGPALLAWCHAHPVPAAAEGVQPLETPDSALLMHGRVDNREALEAALGEGAGAASDTALVRAAWQRWGEESLARIDGEFALAVWDGRARRLLLARDRIGAKPLYYHVGDGCIAFASDIAALHALPWVPQEIDEESIAEYLRLIWPASDGTLWAGVRRVRPAHRMVVAQGETSSTRYWTPLDAPEIRYRDRRSYVDHYRALLFDAVRRMSRSDHPLVFEVSGGLDSSALFAVADQLAAEGRLLAPEIHGVCARFEPGTKAYEWDYVEAVAEHVGRPIRPLPWATWSLEQCEAYAQRHRLPPPYPNGIFQHGTFDFARSVGARACVSGVGGDEWLSGSRGYYAQAISRADLPALLRYLRLETARDGFGEALKGLFWNGIRPFFPQGLRNIPRRLTGRPLHLSARQRYLSEAIIRRARVPDEAQPDPRLRRAPLLAEKMDCLERSMLGVGGDNWELYPATEGLELRIPFFAREIVEFSFAADPALFACGRGDKLLHREAMKGLLPDKLLERQSKAVFDLTFGSYLPEIEHRSEWVETCSRMGWLTHANVAALKTDAADLDTVSLAPWIIWNAYFCASLQDGGQYG